MEEKRRGEAPPLLRTLLQSPSFALCTNILIAGFLSLFVFENVRAWESSADPSYLLVVADESLFVFFYLIRSRAVAVSTSPLDWGIGIAGTFIGTLLRPAAALYAPLGDVLVVVGTISNCIGVLSLNRSIATVAAKRSIKTRGMYAFVRHPLYASESVAIIGYLLVNFSLINSIVVIANISLQLLRIEHEETLLRHDAAYRAYADKVRYKLLPFIY